MIDRMTRAVQAKPELYEEVEHNPSLTNEAYTIVGIVAVIAVIGGLLTNTFLEDRGLLDAVWSGVSVVGTYLLWSFLTYFVGTRFFGGTATWGEMQRTLGYAMTPQLLSFIPCVGFLAALWSLYLGYVAVRQGLDVDTGNALLTIVISFVLAFGAMMVLGIIFGVGAAGLDLITG